METMGMVCNVGSGLRGTRSPETPLKPNEDKNPTPRNPKSLSPPYTLNLDLNLSPKS